MQIGQRKFYVTVDLNQNEAGRQEKVKNVLGEWYRQRAVEKLAERIERYTKLLGKRPNEMRIRAQQKRWGSCSAKGNISLNWKLVMAPISILDYVIVHELCHLVEPNHSKEFWRLVESMISDYKRHRAGLKQNAFLMQIFD